MFWHTRSKGKWWHVEVETIRHAISTYSIQVAKSEYKHHYNLYELIQSGNPVLLSGRKKRMLITKDEKEKGGETSDRKG